MEGHYGNAMTEIALALAMAFFSVMVLAMVSMGAGSSKAVDTANTATAETLRVSPSKPATTAQPVTTKARIIVFYQGQYLDDKLQLVDPTAIGTEEEIILAIDPTLPLSGALDARAALTTRNITVTVLDQRWMRSLKENTK
jgi:hypothetical protein